MTGMTMMECLRFHAREGCSDCKECLEAMEATTPTINRVSDPAFMDAFNELVGRVILGVIPGTSGEMRLMYDEQDIHKGDLIGYIELCIQHLVDWKKRVEVTS